MNARLLKDFHLLVPAALTGVGLLLAAALMHPQSLPYCHLIGCILLAVSSLGGEFDHQTNGQLFSLPVSKQQVWWEKNLVLLIALALLTILFLGSHLWEQPQNPVGDIVMAIIIFPLFAIGTGHGFNLLFGQPKASLFSILGLAAFVFVLSGYHQHPNVVIGFCLAGAGLGFGWYGWKRFHNYEDFHAASNTKLGIDESRSQASTQGTRKPKRLLISQLKNELHLQRLNGLFVGIAVTAGLLIPGNAVRHADIQIMLLLLLFIIPFSSVALAVTEERRLGLQESQLCLPASRTKLWATKLFFCAMIALVLGGITLGGLYLLPGAGADFGHIPVNIWFGYTILAVTVAFAGASLGNGYLQGLTGLCLIVGFAFCLLQPELNFLFDTSGFYVYAAPALRISVLLGCFWIGYHQFTTTSSFGRRLRDAGLTLIMACSLAMVVARTLDANAPWKSAKEDSRISATIPSSLNDAFRSGHENALAGYGPYIRADGRLALIDWYNGRTVLDPIPGKTNWIQVCSDFAGYYALDENGSVWVGRNLRFESRLRTQPRDADALRQAYPPKLTPFHPDKRWRTIHGGGWRRFAAIRDDGTLWQWQISGTLNADLREASQVGTRTDWKDVVCTYRRLVALTESGELMESALPRQIRPVAAPPLRRIRPFGRAHVLAETTAATLLIDATNKHSHVTRFVKGIHPEFTSFSTLHTDAKWDSFDLDSMRIDDAGYLNLSRYDRVARKRAWCKYEESGVWLDADEWMDPNSRESYMLLLAKDGSLWTYQNESQLTTQAGKIFPNFHRSRWRALIRPIPEYERIGHIDRIHELFTINPKADKK